MSFNSDTATEHGLTTPCTPGTKHFLTETCNGAGDGYIGGSETEVGGGGGNGLTAKPSKCGGCKDNYSVHPCTAAIYYKWEPDKVIELARALK